MIRSRLLRWVPCALVAMVGCTDQIVPGQEITGPSGGNYAAAAALAVTDLKVESQRVYEIVPNGLVAGARALTDRPYTFRGPIPEEVAGLTFIRTPVGDKIASPGRANFLSFAVNQDVDVYVALDVRLKPPTWMSGWEATRILLTHQENSDRVLLYKKSFPAGRVVLGSNVDNTSMGNAVRMYTVIIRGSGTGGSDPGEEDPGEEDPGEEDPGEEDPGEENPVPGDPSVPLAITGLTVQSTASYQVVPNGLNPGALRHTDRPYTFLGPISTEIAGHTYLRTPMGDKNASPGRADFLTFTVNRPVWVYVVLDRRITGATFPAWLTGWEEMFYPMGDAESSRRDRVFRKRFETGPVVLGSNVQVNAGSAIAMYNVIVRGVGSTGGADTLPPTVPLALEVAGLGTTSASLRWTASTDNGAVAQYRIFRNGTQVGTSTTNSFTDTGLTAGTTYRYTVAAVDAAGNASAQSEGRDVTTLTSAPSNGTIALQLVRLSTGTGSVLVSNGIPLPAGRLWPNQINRVRVLVGGQEQSIYVEALPSSHRDGSVRSILVQFQANIPGNAPVAAQLDLSTVRTAAARAKTTVTWDVPQAVAVPTSVDFLISTDLVGPTRSVAAANALGGPYARWERDFVTYADYHWPRVDDSGRGDNYYDRALVYYAWWVRSGNLEYLKRAVAHSERYLDEWVVARNYSFEPQFSQMEGLEIYYLLTGNERIREAIGRVGQRYYEAWTPNLANRDHRSVEGRIMARTLMSHLIAWRLNAPGAGLNWATVARQDLDAILSVQGSDGAYRQRSNCYQSLNYMTGLINDALIKYHSWREPDARILPSVRRAVDFLWTQWNQSAGAFAYVSAVCEGTGDTDPASDLNMLQLHGFSWVYAQTGDQGYRTKADLIFDRGVQNAWLNGDKQFNQQYRESYLHLYYRQAR